MKISERIKRILFVSATTLVIGLNFLTSGAMAVTGEELVSGEGNIVSYEPLSKDRFILKIKDVWEGERPEYHSLSVYKDGNISGGVRYNTNDNTAIEFDILPVQYDPIQSEITMLEGDEYVLNVNNEEARSRIEEIDLRIADLKLEEEAQKGGYKELVDILEKEIALLDEAIPTAQGEDLEIKIKARESKIAERNEILKIFSDIEEEIAALESEKETLLKNISDNELAIVEVQKKIEELKPKIVEKISTISVKTAVLEGYKQTYTLDKTNNLLTFYYSKIENEKPVETDKPSDDLQNDPIYQENHEDQKGQIDEVKEDKDVKEDPIYKAHQEDQKGEIVNATSQVVSEETIDNPQTGDITMLPYFGAMVLASLALRKKNSK